MEAYQNLTSALSDAVYYYDNQCETERRSVELSEQRIAELEKYWDDSHHKIRKPADSGGFFFTDDVIEALKKFSAIRDDDFLTYAEYILANLGNAKTCLDRTVQSANRVLRVKDSWLTSWRLWFWRP